MPKLREIEEATRKVDEQRSQLTEHEQRAVALVERTVKGLVEHMDCDGDSWRRMTARSAVDTLNGYGNTIWKGRSGDFLFGIEFWFGFNQVSVPMGLSSNFKPPPLPSDMSKLDDLNFFKGGVTTWRLKYFSYGDVALPAEDDSKELPEIYEDISLAIQSVALGLSTPTDAKHTSYCGLPGLYRTNCPDKVRQHFEKGKLFPPCPACQSQVKWTLLSPSL